MTPDELVARIQAGEAGTPVREFLAANPDVGPYNLVNSALNWGVDAVTEEILRTVREDAPADAFFNLHLGTLYLRQQRFEEALPCFRAVVANDAETAKGYSSLCASYCLMNDLEMLRETVREAQEKLSDKLHVEWQVLNPSAGREERSAFHLKLAEQERARRMALPGGDSKRAPAHLTEARNTAAAAVTCGASEIGTTGAVLHGKAAAGTAEAQFRFEYGATPDQLDRATAWQRVPGRLNAVLTATPFQTPGQIRFHAGAFSTEETVPPLYVGHWPFCKDPNHISGVGFIDLLLGLWFNEFQSDGHQEVHPWETADLRDAEVTIHLVSEDLDTKDFQYVLGVGNGAHYWFLTGQPVDLSSDGTRREVAASFVLSSDPQQWTTAGNNPDEQSNADRYFYGPLETVLGENKGNLVLVAASGDWRDTPVGRIGLYGYTVRYRDHNILHPDNGAVLSAAPEDGSDPAALTDGTRGPLDCGWFCKGSGSLPAVFAWSLPRPQEMGSIVLHQDPVWPVAKCRLKMTTADDQEFAWDLDLPGHPPGAYENPPMIVRLPEGLMATTIGLDILEGTSPEGTGLLAVEAFAREIAPTPSPVPVSICADVTDLAPGETVHYRLVCRDGETTANGEIMSFTPPADTTLLHGVELDHTKANGKAVFRVRANPMGRRTRVCWQVDGNGWSERSIGWERTSGHRFITVRDIRPGSHRLTVRLETDDGPGPETNLDWMQP